MRSAVLVCGDRGPIGEVRGMPDGAEVHVVKDLCRGTKQIGKLAAGADRLVVGVCPGEYSLGAIQTQARRLGIDGLGVEVVDLSGVGREPGRLGVILAGAVARAEEFPGSRAEQTKLTIERTRSRRSLFTLSGPGYVAAPGVDARRCQASTGCSVCVTSCPRGAISWAGGEATLDIAACEPCGLCVAACPSDAMVDPSTTPTMVEAQVRRLLDPSVGPAGPRGIVFACRLATRSEEAGGWYRVTVPCAGMVSSAWLLAPLLMGAARTAVRSCGESGCHLGNDDLVTKHVEFSREILGWLGLDPERVTMRPERLPGPETSSGGGGLGTEVSEAFTATGAGRVLAALASIADMPLGSRFEHSSSPVGVMSIQGDVCTGCGACAEVCPTGALRRGGTDSDVEVSFDAVLCRGCGQCLPSCPEAAAGALTLSGAVDVGALVGGRRVLFSGATVRCASCGGPLAPAKLMTRIQELLGPEQAKTMDFLSSYCLDCRSGHLPSRPRDPAA